MCLIKCVHRDPLQQSHVPIFQTEVALYLGQLTYTIKRRIISPLSKGRRKKLINMSE